MCVCGVCLFISLDFCHLEVHRSPRIKKALALVDFSSPSRPSFFVHKKLPLSHLDVQTTPRNQHMGGGKSTLRDQVVTPLPVCHPTPPRQNNSKTLQASPSDNKDVEATTTFDVMPTTRKISLTSTSSHMPLSQRVWQRSFATLSKYGERGAKTAKINTAIIQQRPEMPKKCARVAIILGEIIMLLFCFQKEFGARVL